MKKKILSGVFALALFATAGWGVNKTMSNDAGLSDLALMNVEALADGEIIDVGRETVPCRYATLTGDPFQGTLIWVCTTCEYKFAKDINNSSECYYYYNSN